MLDYSSTDPLYIVLRHKQPVYSDLLRTSVVLTQRGSELSLRMHCATRYCFVLKVRLRDR